MNWLFKFGLLDWQFHESDWQDIEEEVSLCLVRCCGTHYHWLSVMHHWHWGVWLSQFTWNIVWNTATWPGHRRKLPPNSGGAHGPFLPVPFPPLSSLPLLLRSRAPQIQVGGLGERCKLPQRGLGRSPSRNRIWCILALKSVIWWQQF